jgi:hypothetical protein
MQHGLFGLTVILQHYTEVDVLLQMSYLVWLGSLEVTDTALGGIIIPANTHDQTSEK